VIPGLKKPASTPSGPTYTVTFSETGLSSGTSWSVTLGGTTHSATTSSIAFTESNGTYSYAVGAITGYSVSPSSGSVTVSGSAQSVPVAFTLAAGSYTVTFSESGLTSGTSWSVTLGGNTLSSTTSTIAFTETNGTYTYTVVPVTGYTASPASGSAMVSGADQTVPITFSKTVEISSGAFQITFDQTGLPADQAWYAEADYEGLAGSYFGTSTYGPSDEFAIPNGTYYWYVASLNSSYVAAPYEGTLTVAGAAVVIDITFELLYTVTFTEVGLAGVAEWQVGLNGTYSETTGGLNNTFTVPDGTYNFGAYAFGYTAAPATGSVTVSGAGVTETITFTALSMYSVSFTETGLPSGDYWAVVLNGSVAAAYAPGGIAFAMPNGVYNFSVTVDVYYAASPASGMVTVSGTAQTKMITFTTIPTYSVTFTETGVAMGDTWAVELNGTFNSTTAPGSIGFSVPAGLTPFYAYAVGYYASPTTGNVTVPTHSVSQAIVFSAVPPVTTYQVTITESGLPAFVDYDIDIASNWPVGASYYYCSNASFLLTSAPFGLNCSMPDGYYSWYASTDGANFTASPAAGGITVDGGAVSVTTTFVNSTDQPLIWFSDYAYTETGLGGLPNGTSWSVTYNGTKVTTDGAWVFFLGPNGTKVAWTITAPAGYVVIPSSGNVTWYGNAYQSYDPYDYADEIFVIFLAVDPPAAPFGPDPGANAGPTFAPALAGIRAA
jgi:hypothetical protein